MRRMLMRAAVLVEPGRSLLDEEPRRCVALEHRSYSVRGSAGPAKARGFVIVALVVALSAWAFKVHAAGETEWWLVPIKAGQFGDVGCTEQGHAGMVGQIVIK